MPVFKPLPAAEALNAVLRYEPESGLLLWRVKRGRAAAGQRAGCLSPDGYRRVGVTVGVIRDVRLEHQIIWMMQTGRLPAPGTVIDHINGVKNDNRWSNLREISQSLNVGRAPFPKMAAGRTLPRNVTLDKRRGTYNVQMGCGVNKLCKTGLTLEDATALAAEWRAMRYSA